MLKSIFSVSAMWKTFSNNMLCQMSSTEEHGDQGTGGCNRWHERCRGDGDGDEQQQQDEGHSKTYYHGFGFV